MNIYKDESAQKFKQTRGKKYLLKPQLERVIPMVESGTALDLGCGKGFNIELVKSKGYNYTGIDISEDMVELAKSEYPHEKFLDEGYDFVNTNRVGRWGGEVANRQVKSGLANKIIGHISGVQMKDRGSGLKGFNANVLRHLRLYGTMHRFIPDYLTVYNARMIEFDVDFKDREYGESAYKGQKRTVQVLLDLMTLWFMLTFAKKPFTAMPGRLFGFTGAILSALGGLTSAYLVVLKIFGQDIGSRPLFMTAVMLLIIGGQLMMLGLIGELLMRVYFESTDRKTYVIREIV